jgi:predicted Zn-dependent protease
MEFSNRWGLALASVLLWSSIATAQDTSTQIAVLVNDSVGVESWVLRQAEREAARLFEAAGIEIQWVHCAETDECRHLLGPKEFVLHIVPMGNTRSDFVFGEAFLGEDGRGQYSDVFFDRLRQAEGDIDLALLLGAVSAHELGHLLLGSHAHSQVGIMEPRWKSDSVRRIGTGTMMFTPEQARRMKTRITAETAHASLSRSQGWRTGDRFHTFRQGGSWAERF